MASDHLIYAHHIDAHGHARSMDMHNDSYPAAEDGGYSWLHLCARNQVSRSFLEAHTALDPIVIDALLAEETRPRALKKNNGILVIFRAMNLNKGEAPEDMISIRLWLQSGSVISTRQRDIKAIEDILGLIEAGEPPLCPGDFLVAITDRLFERMGPFFIELEDGISHAEELLASGREDSISKEVALFRKRTAIFLRYVTPQKVVLESLGETNFAWLTKEHREHLDESLDMVNRYVEELNELRNRSQILNDELNNAQGRRLNSIAYIFSVAATIFLPLGFLTGLMGINIGGMPGINSEYAFWSFSGLCALIIIVQIGLFKRLGWF